MEKGTTLQPSERRELVRILISHLTFNNQASCQQFRQLSSSINKKYPNSISDKIGKEVIGCGVEGFVQQLTNRYDNENRKSSIKKRKLHEVNESVKDKYGSINWSINMSDEEEKY